MTEGKKFDSGKDRWDLLPWYVIQKVVKVLTFGVEKYGAWNWLDVPGARERYDAALERHLVAWRLGEKTDPETGLPHLAHALCCLIFIAHLDDKEAKPRPIQTS